MPRIRVRNDSSLTVNVGFYILGMLHPSRHTNGLHPGATFEAGDFPSFLPQSFEVRDSFGTFNDGETVTHVAQMAAAGAAGTAAVLTGTTVLRGRADNIANAKVFWNAACAGGTAYGKEMPATMKRVGIAVLFEAMELVLRDGPDGIEVWSGDKRL
ncbi:hypothetical protein BDZ89DRAFT_1057271 [Hymenopellis radicata]|nr:hypothetical protein BDZ89DRAFT_1057271 [Hymenopellis radicata]